MLSEQFWFVNDNTFLWLMIGSSLLYTQLNNYNASLFMRKSSHFYLCLFRKQECKDSFSYSQFFDWTYLSCFQPMFRGFPQSLLLFIYRIYMSINMFLEVGSVFIGLYFVCYVKCSLPSNQVNCDCKLGRRKWWLSFDLGEKEPGKEKSTLVYSRLCYSFFLDQSHKQKNAMSFLVSQ